MSLEHGVKEKWKRDNPKSKKYDKKFKILKTNDLLNSDKKE